MSNPRTRQGFTLIEVLVALTIIALLATVSLRVATQSLRSAAQIEKQTFALWLADNYLTEVRLGARQLDMQKQVFTAPMGNRDWQIVVEQHPSAQEPIIRIEISVFEETDESVGFSLLSNTPPLARLTGFMRREQP